MTDPDIGMCDMCGSEDGPRTLCVPPDVPGEMAWICQLCAREPDLG